mmetsp:Transcript_21017/g.26123  ORF Transcript_21017/g.26123 Transcript_21017/m.26123 type:complete len:161 (+) Transcript_21017:50-532(+)
MKNIVFLFLFSVSSAFILSKPVNDVRPVRSSKIVSQMGIFDFFKNAFANELFDDRRVKASHILVKTEEEANEIAKKIETTEITFADAAREFSTCPSSKAGGSLGEFGPGKMVPQFDQVCFDESIEPQTVVGPVKTAFGFHLIKIDKRFVNTNKSEGSSVF